MKISNFKFKILIFLISFLTLTKFNLDPDLWWHMAMGREFLEKGRIIRADEFSFTMPGYIWGNSYFLYQILVTFIFNNFGHILLSVFFGIVASAGVLVIVKKLDLIKLAVIGVSTFMAGATLGIRPHTVSFLFFSVLLIFLEKKLYLKAIFLPFWFLFFAFWANFHRGFLVGIAILLAFIIFEFLITKKKNDLIKGGLSFLTSLIGTFLTPFPLKLWHSGVVLDLTSKPNLSTIAEWLPIAVYWQISMLFAICGVIFIYLFYKHAKRDNLPWFFIGGALFALSFVAATFVFYWVAVFIFIVSRYLEFKFEKKLQGMPILVVILVAAYFFCGFGREFLQSKNLEKRMILDGYPVDAVGKIDFSNLSGGFYNDYVWGGYIDYWKPQHKVFIDGRMASWRFPDGDSILHDYNNLASGRCETLQKYNLEVALVKADFKSKCFDGWQIKYRDNIAKILTKTHD